ncbi:MAG: NmrA/HSCARG family protein [Bryobacteraceae bacterium]
MSETKIITVVGATGSQGGGLVRAIQANPRAGFRARAIARDPKSDKAQALAALGAEVVAGDVDDAASLRKAFEGAHGAYCVTFYWAHMSPDKERIEAANLASAAKAASVSHVVWSTLEDTRKFMALSDPRMPTLMDKYKVPHFDVKGECDKFFADSGVPTTNLLTSFYWDNFINLGMGPKKGPDGRYAITLPMGNSRMSGIAAEDIGRCGFGIFQAGSDYAGKTVGIASDHLTGDEIARTFTEVLGVEVVYNAITPEIYRSFGFPGADDLGNMFQFYRDFANEFNAARSVDESRQLNPKLQNFRQWLETNKQAVPLEATIR